MNPAFPPESLVAGLLEGVPRKDLARRAAELSRAYREGQNSGRVAAREDALAYLLARAPATFAAIRAVLGAAMAVVPDFAPSSLLDIGSGPGTAAHAAIGLWPSLAGITLVEPNPVFRQLAAHLLPQAKIVAGEPGGFKADLVTAAYVLAELPNADAGRFARDLWGSAKRMLVLVEPGTPQGFARIRSARAALIEGGAHITAPCTHDNICPMAGSVGENRSDHEISDWCHFRQRLARTRDHMILKDASVPFEDERYSYLVATREKFSKGARIIKPPVEAKAGIMLPLCDETGLRDHFVPRRDKEACRRARKLDWGDLLKDSSP